MNKIYSSTEGKVSITNVEFENTEMLLQFVDDVVEDKLTQRELAAKYNIDDKGAFAKTGNVKRIVREILNRKKDLVA